MSSTALFHKIQRTYSDNAPYSLFSPTPRPEWLADNEFCRYTQAESDKCVELLERATAHCFDAIAQTWECDTLCFWKSVHTDDLFLWLQNDESELATAIATKGLTWQLERRIASLVSLMHMAEMCVYRMKVADIDEIIGHEGDAAQLAATYLYLYKQRMFYEDGDQARFEDWYDEDENPVYHVDEKLYSAPGYGSWATAMTAHEVLRIIKGRAARSHQPEQDTTRIVKTGESTQLIDDIRATSFSTHTAFLLDTAALPAALQPVTTERLCLAATVDDACFEPAHLSVLGERNIGFHLVSDRPNGIPAPVITFADDSLCIDSRHAVIFLQNARTERAILYIGTQQCCLVVQPYKHFAEQYELVDKDVEARQCPDRYTVISLQDLGREKDHLRPIPRSLKRNMVDLRQGLN